MSEKTPARDRAGKGTNEDLRVIAAGVDAALVGEEALVHLERARDGAVRPVLPGERV